MSYLIVVAHPDDEVLGAGATIYKLVQSSIEVNVCVMSGQAQARAFRPDDLELESNMQNSMRLLGITKTFIGDFPNIRLNTVPHLELVQFIEKAIIDTKADIVITHQPADLNNDHLHTSLACQEAIRYFQRRKDIKPIKELLFMEVPSATEWATNSSMNRFNPNTFIEVGEDAINKKIAALSEYKGVMRDYPHPRSSEALKGLAAFRGSQSGCIYAEAFELVFRREIINSYGAKKTKKNI